MSSPFKGAPREVSGCCGESAGSVWRARVHAVVARMRANWDCSIKLKAKTDRFVKIQIDPWVSFRGSIT